MKRFLLSFLLIGIICEAACSQSGYRGAHYRLKRTGPPNYRPLPRRESPTFRVTVAPHYSDLALARRHEAKQRAEERRQRMLEFQAARAEQAQRDYEDWHERYLADTPVREKYYEALDSAYRAEEVLAYERAAYAPRLYVVDVWPGPLGNYWGDGFVPYPGGYFFYGW